MRFCKSTIFASLTSRGACTAGASGTAREGVTGFLPPVSHMMTTITTATLMRSHDCTFLGSRPGGLGALSWIGAGEVIAVLSFRGEVPAEVQLFLAHDEVPCIDNLGNDVDAVLELERDQIWFAVLELVQNGLFAGGAADVGEGVVVIDGRN